MPKPGDVRRRVGGGLRGFVKEGRIGAVRRGSRGHSRDYPQVAPESRLDLSPWRHRPGPRLPSPKVSLPLDSPSTRD